MSYPNSGLGASGLDDSPPDSGLGGGGGGFGAGGGSYHLGPRGSATGGGGGNSPPSHQGSFQLPPRNPVLESFVNDTQGYADPSQALSAAESRCVGLVASAESFAQQRHAKLQQLFKKIQAANNEEVSDLTGRVAICESALQELSVLLEQVQLHISSASSATREFIRSCTVERGKAEGRLLASLNAMLIQYEQQRRAWRKSAAQLLVRQDLEGLRAELDTVFGFGLNEQQPLDDDQDFNETADAIAQGGAHMGFLALEQQALQQQRERNGDNDDDNDETEEVNPRQQQPQTPIAQVRGNNNNNTQFAPQPPAQQATTQNSNNSNNKHTKLLKYLPVAVRERRRTVLSMFSNMLGQMLIDGDSVDRPFLLDATYARIIRYADVLSLHGEVICRHVAEMFRNENQRRTHFLLDKERAIFIQNAEALCPPNMVPIGDEPVYTTFVGQLVEQRLEREVKCLQMMDAGLEAGKQATQKALDAVVARFKDSALKIVATVTKNGVMLLHQQHLLEQQQQQQQQDGNNAHNISFTLDGSAAAAGAISNNSVASNNNSVAGGLNNASITSTGGASIPIGRRAAGRSVISAGAGGGSNISVSGATEANVAALVSRLLHSSFGENLAEPDSTDEALRKMESNAMQRVFFRLLQEVANTLEQHHTQLSDTFHETIAAVQPSPINLINNPTVFSLESLQSELAHQALLLKVASSADGTERGRLAEQLKEERNKNNALLHDNDDKTKRLIVVEAEKAAREAEVHELEAAVKSRSKTQLNMKTEVKKITYLMTSEAFGKGWQESVLMLRESMMKQMQAESSRLLARVKAYQKRKFDDQSRIVELLESGFLATQDSIEADHDAKVREQQVRHEVELQRVKDECEVRVRNAHRDAEDEIRRSREMFERMYKERVDDLNESYDHKVRQIEMRQRDWEERLWNKMKQIRADYREKEVQIEQQYAKKHEAVLKIYEEEANTLKRNISEKEALLESERLSVHLEIERQINDGINKVKAQYEAVRSELQNTMLHYLQGQRELFDNQRKEEMAMFSEFAFGGMQFAKETAFGIVESNRKSFQSQIDASQKSIQDATLSANDVTGRLLKHRDELHDARLISIRGNNENVLRKTQLVRIEQDERTWNNLHREIVSKGSELDKKQGQVEMLMTQRYIDIVKTLHGYIQGDVSAAHQTFERECGFRQEQLRRYLNHFHMVSLRIESEVWREQSARNDIEREAMSLMHLLMSRSRTEAEYVVRNAIIQGHVATLNQDAEETTFTTVEALRARYEGLLRRQHQLMGAMSHDYVSSLQHYVAQTNATAEATSNIFSQRMDELHVAMRHRWELHWSSRDMLVERRLEALVQVAAQACRELLGGALLSSSGSSPLSGAGGRRRSPPQHHQRVGSGGASANSASVIVIDDGEGGGASNNNNNNNNAVATATAPLFFAQDVRVVEYFTSMRELLSKTFEELEKKINSGLEERELRQRQHAMEMRARFLEAAGALTRRAEQLEDKILETKMENNSLHAKLQLKTEAEIRAATLAEDLKALVGHYRLLTQNVLVHGAFNNEIGADGKMFTSHGGLVPGGAFRRTHLLQRQNTNVPTTLSGAQQHYQNLPASLLGLGASPSLLKKHFSSGGDDGNDDGGSDDPAAPSNRHPQQHQQQQHFQAMFLVDVGGKKATRDVVMENALLRERLMASEWKNDKFLRDALMSAHVEETLLKK